MIGYLLAIFDEIDFEIMTVLNEFGLSMIYIPNFVIKINFEKDGHNVI